MNQPLKQTNRLGPGFHAALEQWGRDYASQAIERLVERGTIQHPPLGEVKNHSGQTVEVYQIGERDSYVVVAQLSPEFTARLVDYWRAHKFLRSLPIEEQA